ncbi:MAG: hypothetical protein AAF799_04305 [Myxococcota bacterium]
MIAKASEADLGRVLIAMAVLVFGCGPGAPTGTNGEPGASSSTTGVVTPLTATGQQPETTTTRGASTGTTGGADEGSGTTGPSGPCSMVEQDCPPGEKCLPYANDSSSWNDRHCVPVVDEPQGPDEPCSVFGDASDWTDDCDATSMCRGASETGTGYCIEFCIGDDTNPFCANRCDYCPVFGESVVSVCLQACDPLAPDCFAGEACLPSRSGNVFACSVFAPSPDGAFGDPCRFINACIPGSVCWGGEGVPDCDGPTSGCCMPYCPLEGPDPCPTLLTGTICTSVGWEEAQGCTPAPVGLCLLP